MEALRAGWGGWGNFSVPSVSIKFSVSLLSSLMWFSFLQLEHSCFFLWCHLQKAFACSSFLQKVLENWGIVFPQSIANSSKLDIGCLHWFPNWDIPSSLHQCKNFSWTLFSWALDLIFLDPPTFHLYLTISSTNSSCPHYLSLPLETLLLFLYYCAEKCTFLWLTGQ